MLLPHCKAQKVAGFPSWWFASSARADGSTEIPALGLHRLTPASSHTHFLKRQSLKCQVFPSCKLPQLRLWRWLCWGLCLCVSNMVQQRAIQLGQHPEQEWRWLEHIGAVTSVQTETSQLALSYTYQQQAKVKYTYYCYYLSGTISSCLFTKALFKDKAALATETLQTQFSAGLKSWTRLLSLEAGPGNPKGLRAPPPRGQLKAVS